MAPQHPQNKFKQFSLNILLLLVLSGFFSSPAKAQWPMPFSPFGFQANSAYLPFAQVPTYPFFTPFSNPIFSNPFGAQSRFPGLPTASVMGSLAPFPGPIARIQDEEAVEPVFLGVTTIFLDPAITLLDKVVVKPLDGEPIKLSAIIPPLTVYIFPSGYVPSTAPISVVNPTAVLAPPVPITVAIPTPPPTTLTPAEISGRLLPFAPYYNPFVPII
jgi:hypothetical protein